VGGGVWWQSVEDMAVAWIDNSPGGGGAAELATSANIVSRGASCPNGA